jgi:hypothetical protein
MNEIKFPRLLAVGLTALLCLGCGESIDPEILAARQKVLLATPPPAPQSIAAAKEAAESATPVTLIGRIDAGDFDPFDKQVAAFVLSEVPTAHEQSEGHDADNCPFCKRRAANAPKAHVTMVDDTGTAIKHAAPTLLGVRQGSQVIVQGTGSWNPELNVLEFQATSIYLNP